MKVTKAGRERTEMVRFNLHVQKTIDKHVALKKIVASLSGKMHRHTKWSTLLGLICNWDKWVKSEVTSNS